MTTVPEILTNEYYTQLLDDITADLKPYVANQQSAMAYITAIYAENLVANRQSELLSSENLANLHASLFSKKWLKIAQALYADYNPIHNYDMSESGNDYQEQSESVQSYSNFADTTTGTDTIVSADGHSTKAGTKAGNITVSESGIDWNFVTETEPETTVYGTTMDDVITSNKIGNTITAGATSNVDTSQQLHTYDISHGKTGEIHNRHSPLPFTISDNLLNVDIVPDSAGGHKMERKGNIGVTTTQNMINQEIQLRKNYDLLVIMVNDVINACSGGYWI